MILAGCGATPDGRVISGHNNDLQAHNAGLFELLPHALHDEGIIELSSGARIPQPRETKRCLILKTWRGYAEGDAVAVNEDQVSVAGGVDLGHDRNEAARRADPLVPAGVSGAVRYIALQQSAGARECVERIGEYYTKYGVSYTCGIGITDTREAWYVEAGGGSCWLAVRVPDDCYMSQANSYRIGEVDLSDGKNVIASPGLLDFCRSNGLWDPAGGPFHFARAFGGRMAANPKLRHFNSRRAWGTMRLFNPSMNLDPGAGEYPLFLKPEKKLTAAAVMSALRDRYEGTPFDAFPQQGGFGADRPVCVPSCVHSDVIELRSWMPAEAGALMWGCLASPETSPYIPFHFGVRDIPAAYTCGGPSFDQVSAFWRFRSLSNLAMVNFRELSPLVRPAWEELEGENLAMTAPMEEAALSRFDRDPSTACDLLTAFSGGAARRAVARASEMEAELQTRIAETVHLVFSEPELGW